MFLCAVSSASYRAPHLFVHSELQNLITYMYSALDSFNGAMQLCFFVNSFVDLVLMLHTMPHMCDDVRTV